jgi:hypothetical protein
VGDGDEAADAAELEGYGPIDAATARRLASLAPTWERILTDLATGAALGVGHTGDLATGAALGVGRTGYRPPAALRRYLAHRDRGCIFPGCPAPTAPANPTTPPNGTKAAPPTPRTSPCCAPALLMPTRAECRMSGA